MRLLRPPNILIAMLGVAVGGLLAAGFNAFGALGGAARGRLLVAALSAALIGGAANSLNDVFDLDIDRVNRPGRPLPSGQVAVGTARAVWALASAVGLVLSVLLSPLHLALAAGSVVLLYAYCARLKRTVLVGNVLVALVVALALLYGGAAVGQPGPALVGSVFVFLTTLVGEIAKDIEDVTGNGAAGARTLPFVHGPEVAARVAALVLGMTLVLIPAPFLAFGYSGLYLLLVLAAAGFLLRALWLLLTPDPSMQAGRVSALVKTAMLFGLAALAFAHLPE